MIHYVFFDVGGVLSTDTKQPILIEIEKALGVSKSSFENEFDRLSEDLQRGCIEESYFLEAILESVNAVQGTSLDLKLVDIYRQHTRPITRNIDLGRKLRNAGYSTGIITNTIQSFLDYNRTRGLLDDFEPVVASCEVGMIKPEEEIYLLAARRAGVDPRDCIFVDDKIKFLEVASKLGFTTVHYFDGINLESELRRFGVEL